MWVNLDPDPRGIPLSVGSGIVKKHKRVAVYPIEALSEFDRSIPDHEIGQQDQAQPATIAEVMSWARERVAVLAGVPIDAVKLDLKLEY
jgi:hypothetical protein